MRRRHLPTCLTDCHKQGDSLPAGQFKQRDLGSGAQPLWHTDSSDSTIDVEVSTVLFKPPFHVSRNQAAGGKAGVNEFQGNLTAVRVAGEAEVDAQLSGAIEAVGVVGKKDVGCVGLDQRFNTMEVRAGDDLAARTRSGTSLVVDTD